MHDPRNTLPPQTADRMTGLASRLDLQPLSARSIVLSVLLGNHPPALAVGTLVRFAALFGIAPGALRTALSRMVAARELVNEDGTYWLSGRMLERQAEQDSGLAALRSEWDGTWWTALVVAERRTMAERRAFRSTMVGHRMGELRPDTWMRPANLTGPSHDTNLVLTRGPIEHGDEDALTAMLWDLPSLEGRARALREELERAADHLAADHSHGIAETFLVSAACVQFLRTEPQLPQALVDTSAADDLRTIYPEVNATFRQTLRHHLLANT